MIKITKILIIKTRHHNLSQNALTDVLVIIYLKSKRFLLSGPFKILYTDYDHIMIPYICSDVQLNGECSEVGKRLRIMSRTKTITFEVKADLMKYMDIACVDPANMHESSHEGMLKMF